MSTLDLRRMYPKSMALAEELESSEYLLTYYIEALGAFHDFEVLEDGGQKADAQSSLTKAASIVCTALSRLQGDNNFWDALTEMQGPLKEHRDEIQRNLDEIELFLAEEETILLERNIPQGLIRPMLLDLARSVSAFRGYPELIEIADMRKQLAVAAGTICDVASSFTTDEPKWRRWRRAVRTREGLAVLMGAATIVINATAQTMTQLQASVSVGAGLVGMFTCLNWLEPRRRG